MHYSPFSETPAADLSPGTGEIHLWLGSLDVPEPDYPGFARLLSGDERARAGRFHRHEDRRRFIARHGMLRRILGGYLDVDPGALVFSLGGKGKPELAGPSCKGTVRFNISHTRGTALFAFTRTREVGVDIEGLRDIPEMEQLVERFFSAGEQTYFRAVPQDRRRDVFFDCWTRKEAFLKATGEGLTRPLDSFDVAPLPDEGPAGTSAERGQGGLDGWSIRSLMLPYGYAGALAVEGTSCTMRYFTWTTAFAHEASLRGSVRPEEEYELV